MKTFFLKLLSGMLWINLLVTQSAFASDTVLQLEYAFKYVFNEQEVLVNRLKDNFVAPEKFSAIQIFLTKENDKEEINKWAIFFLYPGEKIVVLNAFFDPEKPNPPQFIVRFPHHIKYVCYDELRAGNWAKDLAAIKKTIKGKIAAANEGQWEKTTQKKAFALALENTLHTLYADYNKKCKPYASVLEQSMKKGIEAWRYVPEAHKWTDYIDNLKLDLRDDDAINALQEKFDQWRKSDGFHTLYFNEPAQVIRINLIEEISEVEKLQHALISVDEGFALKDVEKKYLSTGDSLLAYLGLVICRLVFIAPAPLNTQIKKITFDELGEQLAETKRRFDEWDQQSGEKSFKDRPGKLLILFSNSLEI